MWVIPEVTPEFEARMLDVLALYERPYNPKEPVVCLDEKNHQLLSTPRGSQPMRPKAVGVSGTPKRTDYEYQRQGVRNEFVILEPKVGRRHIRTTKHRTGRDWAKTIRHLAERMYPTASTIHLVEDNLNTHNPRYLTEVYGTTEAAKLLAKLTFHPTPKHASWLNMAEIEIGAFTRAVLKRRVATDEQLATHKNAYVRRRNLAKTMVNWTFTPARAQAKFGLENLRGN